MSKTYSIDPSHSQVGFSVRHLGFTKVHGRFGEFEGTIQLTPGQLDTFSAEVSIKAASIDTQNGQRDEHLRSGDFFEADSYSELTFRSTGVENVSGESFTLKGELTIRGVSKEVSLDATYLGEATDPWGGKRIAAEASTKINRKDFGLTWNQALETGGVLVSDTVELIIEVQAVAQD